MLIVDIANSIWLENDSPKEISIPAVAYWIRTNLGKLNSILYEDFCLNQVTLEIQNCNSNGINDRAVMILKVLFRLYMADLDIRKMIHSSTRDTILKATDQEFSIEKINKSELLKTLTTIKKDTLKELWDLVHTYRGRDTVHSVSGDDIVEGHFEGIWSQGYVRNI